MHDKKSNLYLSLFRSSLGALILAAGLLPAAYAEAPAYAARRLNAKIPPAAAPAAVQRGSAAGYLSQAQLEIKDFPPPPAVGSAEDKADLAAVLQWQQIRTPEQCKAALAQSDESFISFFREVNPFPAPLPPAVGAFFKRVGEDAGNANRYVKKIYKRERPFLRSQQLDPCLGRAQGFSYPSGHATVSHLFGLILSDLLPRQGAIFMRAADQGALNRVIGGVHHPSDVEQGKVLGDRLYQEMQKNPAFVADMNALAGYLR